MLTTGAYSSLQNYGFIITFPSKSENINSCYISGFKSLFSTDLSLSARGTVVFFEGLVNDKSVWLVELHGLDF